MPCNQQQLLIVSGGTKRMRILAHNLVQDEFPELSRG